MVAKMEKCCRVNDQLMNNSVYGKTMKNVRKRSDVKLVSYKKDYLKWITKSGYMSHKIFEWFSHDTQK